MLEEDEVLAVNVMTNAIRSPCKRPTVSNIDYIANLKFELIKRIREGLYYIHFQQLHMYYFIIVKKLGI